MTKKKKKKLISKYLQGVLDASYAFAGILWLSMVLTVFSEFVNDLSAVLMLLSFVLIGHYVVKRVTND